MKITFLSPVRHDGKDYSEDDSVEMNDDAANALIEAGVAVFSGKKTTKVAPKVTPKVPEPTDSDNANGSTDSGTQDSASGGEENDGEGQA